MTKTTALAIVVDTTASSGNRLASDAPRADPLGAPVRDVLAVYRAELADVRFPDVDAAVLQSGADTVLVADAEVARLELALDAARRALDERHDALVHTCGRAVAYARVYAIGNDELMARLDGITLPRGRQRTPAAVAAPAAKRRGKRAAPGETLFPGEAPQEGVDDAAQ